MSAGPARASCVLARGGSYLLLLRVREDVHSVVELRGLGVERDVDLLLKALAY